MPRSLLDKAAGAFRSLGCRFRPGHTPQWHPGRLEEGWVLANHKLVSFHVAFLSSLLMLSGLAPGGGSWDKWAVLKFMFSPLGMEVWISAAIVYLSWHLNIAIHELGHWIAAVKTNNLREHHMAAGQKNLGNLGYYLKAILLIPWGKFPGVTKQHGSYFPDVKAQNLAVSSAGPLISQKLSLATLPLGIILCVVALVASAGANDPKTIGDAVDAVARAAAGEAGHMPAWVTILLIAGRLLATVGIVAMLDRFLADPGAVKKFRARTSGAAAAAAEARRKGGAGGWDTAAMMKKMLEGRSQTATAADGREVHAPWQYRNCLMGGRHTEDQGGNLSFQEFMFVPLSAADYVEAQRMTSALQTRVIQIVQDSEGMNFVGIGLEGGMVGGYTKQADDACAEERALKVAVQAIEECGFVPGTDVALALDPAASELEIAFREQTGQEDAVGQYYFWRAEEPLTMSSHDLIEMFKDWVAKYPIVSIEDGLAEDDHEAWKELMKELGDQCFIIGDDLVTTKDTNIIEAAENGLINTVLVKANQIGTLCETLLATHAGKERGCAMVVSHRSKSPNDTMEADIAFAINSMGMKCGGGANTERLVKYARIVELMTMARKGFKITRPLAGDLKIADISATEVATNAGIPTVGVTVRLENGVTFQGGTPLGTSAGTDEAIHLVDSVIEQCPAVSKHGDLFEAGALPKTVVFKKGTTGDAVAAKNDADLSELWRRAQRYNGKGCLNAAENVETYIAPLFQGKALSEVGGLVDVDTLMLAKEAEIAIERGKLDAAAPAEEKVAIAQRKANLGMNAILSTSLAMGRLVAARDGVELSDVLRDLEGNIDREALYGVKA